LALPVKALHVGQEDYWLDQIAKDREEYFSGRGESPGRFIGEVADASGLSGEATAEQVRALARGLDPATGEVRCKPLWRADPRSKLNAAPPGLVGPRSTPDHRTRTLAWAPPGHWSCLATMSYLDRRGDLNAPQGPPSACSAGAGCWRMRSSTAAADPVTSGGSSGSSTVTLGSCWWPPRLRLGLLESRSLRHHSE